MLQSLNGQLGTVRPITISIQLKQKSIIVAGTMYSTTIAIWNNLTEAPVVKYKCHSTVTCITCMYLLPCPGEFSQHHKTPRNMLKKCHRNNVSDLVE